MSFVMKSGEDELRFNMNSILKVLTTSYLCLETSSCLLMASGHVEDSVGPHVEIGFNKRNSMRRRVISVKSELSNELVFGGRHLALVQLHVGCGLVVIHGFV